MSKHDLIAGCLKTSHSITDLGRRLCTVFPCVVHAPGTIIRKNRPENQEANMGFWGALMDRADRTWGARWLWKLWSTRRMWSYLTELESSACLLSKWNKVNRLLLPYKTNSVFSVIFSGWKARQWVWRMVGLSARRYELPSSLWREDSLTGAVLPPWERGMMTQANPETSASLFLSKIKHVSCTENIYRLCIMDSKELTHF